MPLCLACGEKFEEMEEAEEHDCPEIYPEGSIGRTFVVMEDHSLEDYEDISYLEEGGSQTWG